ncbi:MAG: conjugal transfer protein TrbD [Candidatus Adiutrix sp.]
MSVIRRSLHRHKLVFGGDAELVQFSALGAFLTALSGVGSNFTFTAISALIFWLTALYWLRKFAKKDPRLRDVWLRHIRQQDIYLAKSCAFQRTAWRKGG